MRTILTLIAINCIFSYTLLFGGALFCKEGSILFSGIVFYTAGSVFLTSMVIIGVIIIQSII
jgi:hypothetical protein